MAYMNKYQSDDYRRDELIRIIEHSVEKLTLAELEALYKDLTKIYTDIQKIFQNICPVSSLYFKTI